MFFIFLGVCAKCKSEPEKKKTSLTPSENLLAVKL